MKVMLAERAAKTTLKFRCIPSFDKNILVYLGTICKLRKHIFCLFKKFFLEIDSTGLFSSRNSTIELTLLLRSEVVGTKK